MTEEEFKELRTGDIIENSQTKSRYVVINDGSPVEPITQLRVSNIKDRKGQFNVLIKRKDNDNAN